MTKLILPLLVSLVAIGSPALKKGASDSVFEEALNKTLAMAGSADLLPGELGEIAEENTPAEGSFLKLTTKQGDVSIKWDISGNGKKIYKKSAWDKEHMMIEMNYPEIGQQDDTFNFSIKSMSCNGTTKNAKQLADLYGADLKYSVTLKANTVKYPEITIKDICSLNDEETGYNIIDYSNAANIWFKNEYSQEQAYYAVKGQVVYVAPDFNWIILADGGYYTELFFGSSDAERAKNFPALRPGKIVEVHGDMAAYKGNMQVSYVTRARELPLFKSLKVKPAKMKYTNVDADFIEALEISNGKHNAFVDGFMNSLIQVTGSYVPGSLANDGGTKVSSITSNTRHTFMLQVGEKQFKVAYDYHVHILGDDQTIDDLETIAMLNEIIANPDSEYTLKGTARYEGTNEDFKGKAGSGSGVWTIVPFTQGKMAMTKGAKAGITVGAVAVAAGISVGLFFFLKKKKPAVAE